MAEFEALRQLIRVAEGRGLRVLLIGAMARQLVFDGRYDIPIHRATLDIDAVVRSESWDAYDALVEVLARNDFTRRSDHSFPYRNGEQIDLLPFGGVADDAGNLIWPGSGRAMSLAGLETAEAHSEGIDHAGMEVRVASLPSLVALKLYAFRDRFAYTEKDLGDLLHVLSNASEALAERACVELGEELADLDDEQVGPYLLGRDLAGITGDEEREVLLEIIASRILDAPEYRALNRAMRGNRVGEAVALFEAFREGLVTSSGKYTG